MRKRSLVFGLIVWMVFVSSNGFAGNCAVGLSPYQNPDAAKIQVQKVIRFMAESLGPGESCYVFDAFNLSTLGTFSVPDKKSFSHPKARLAMNKKLVVGLLKFAKKATRPDGKVSVSGAVLLPKALRFVSGRYSGKETSVIILGSPIFDDPKDPGFTMADGRVPNDTHFTKNLGETPFGVAGQDQALAQFRVHLGFPDRSWVRDTTHEFYVKRFWTLFIENQGGQLGAFTDDLPTLFDNFMANSQVQVNDYQLEVGGEELKMVLRQPPEVQEEKTEIPVAKEEVSIYDRLVSTQPVSISQIEKASDVMIGVSWKCRCDLDVYARPSPDSETLYFGHKRSKEGRYFKDFMNSPRNTNGFETIAFDIPINLKDLLLVVNLYSGSISSSVEGEIRIAFNGKTYANSFKIQARQGNSGHGRHNTIRKRKAANANWTVIDPMKIVTLINPL